MYTYDTELMHFGVLGMHWGVRRYQPYSTTGPRKGGKRGKEIGEAAKAKRGSSGSGTSTVKKKRRKWSELSKEEQDSIKRKVIIGAAGVAVAAIAGTAAYKIGKDQLGYTVRKTTLERVTQSSDADIHHRIYTATKKDRKAYSGLLANQLDQGFYGAKAGGGAYRHVMDVDKVKVAGDIPAKKAFKQLYKSDPTFKLYADSAKKRYEDLHRQNPQIKVSKDTYEAFNRTLKQYGGNHDVQQKKFYDALKSKGFDAVHDKNDRSFFIKGSKSGYGSKDANILFNTNKVKKVSTINISKEERDKLQKQWTTANTAKQLANLGIFTASPLLIKGGVEAGSTVNQAIKDERAYQKKKKGAKK